MTTYLCASKCAAKIGMYRDTFMRLYRQGCFPAAIHEGRLIRFDVEEVRAALGRRARKFHGSRTQKKSQPTTPPTCDTTVCL